MPDDEINISALLRLKRYEQPPPGYFDQLLRDVHRRQRAELLKRPLWRIAIERMQTYFSEHSMGGLSYAGSMAAVLLAGVLAIRILTPGVPTVDRSAPALASNASPQSAPPTNRLITLQEQPVILSPVDFPNRQPVKTRAERAAMAPRYIIDARPVSYERPPSF
jgi:hypothetical protein